MNFSRRICFCSSTDPLCELSQQDLFPLPLYLGVSALNKLKSIEPITLPSVLGRFQTFDQEGFHSGNKCGDLNASIGNRTKVTVLLDLANPEPRETVPTASQPVSGVFPHALAHSGLRAPPNVDDPTAVVEEVDTRLGTEVNILTSRLLYTE